MRKLAAMVVLALVFCGIGQPAHSVDSFTLDPFESEVVRLVNIERAEVDAPPLTVSVELSKYSRYWSQYMAQSGRMAHGPNPWSNYPTGWWAAAENVAVHYANPASVVGGWMHSTGHRDNILNPSLTHIGVGYAKTGGTPYWTQNFARYPDGVNPDANAAAPHPFGLSPVPTVSGEGRVGATLRAAIGAWDEFTVLRVQWLRDGTPITGVAGSIYQVAATDAGHSLAVRVTGQRYGRITAARTSRAIAVPGAPGGPVGTPGQPGAGNAPSVPTRPAGTKLKRLRPVVAVSGRPVVRRVLRARVRAVGATTESPVRIKYRWLRNGKPIKGATAGTYRVRKADIGKRIRVRVKVTKRVHRAAVVRSKATERVRERGSSRPSAVT